MTTKNRITYLSKRLRSRLNGDMKDISRDFNPDDKSSDACLRFDQYVEENIKKYGEKKVEEMLQRFYDKAKDINREAELRVWEMRHGPEPTFADRAFKWGYKEEYIHRRAHRVKAVHNKIDQARKGKGVREEQGSKTRRAREQEQDELSAGRDCGVEKKQRNPRGGLDQETQAGGQKDSTPNSKPKWEPRPDAPTRRSSRQIDQENEGRGDSTSESKPKWEPRPDARLRLYQEDEGRRERVRRLA